MQGAYHLCECVKGAPPLRPLRCCRHSVTLGSTSARGCSSANTTRPLLEATGAGHDIVQTSSASEEWSYGPKWVAVNVASWLDT